MKTGGVRTSGLLTVRDGQTMTTDLQAQAGWSPLRLAGTGLGSAPRRHAAGWPAPSTSQPGLGPPADVVVALIPRRSRCGRPGGGSGARDARFPACDTSFAIGKAV